MAKIGILMVTTRDARFADQPAAWPHRKRPFVVAAPDLIYFSSITIRSREGTAMPLSSFRQAAATLAAGLLFGCSAQAPTTAPEPPAAPGAERRVLAIEDELTKPAIAFLTRLDLSDDQRQRLQGVVAHAFVLAEPMIALLKRQLSGAEVDPTALGCALRTLMQMDAAQDARTLDELRAILTSEQRRAAAEAIAGLADPSDDWPARLIAELNKSATSTLGLNAAQQAKLTQALDDFLAFWRRHQQAYLAALATHMREGGREQLQQRFETLNRAYVTDHAAAFLASLDQRQRRALLDHIDSLKPRVGDVLAATRQRSKNVAEPRT